jgi:hypothetical protein
MIDNFALYVNSCGSRLLGMIEFDKFAAKLLAVCIEIETLYCVVFKDCCHVLV